jgi:hypothetical protein
LPLAGCTNSILSACPMRALSDPGGTGPLPLTPRQLFNRIAALVPRPSNARPRHLGACWREWPLTRIIRDVRDRRLLADGCLWRWRRNAALRRNAQFIHRLLCANIGNRGSRPILLKNSKMQPSQFLANLDRRRGLLPRIVAGSIRTILVARSTKSRLPPRPKLNGGPEGLQSFEHLRKRSFSSAPVRPARSRWCKSAALKV